MTYNREYGVFPAVVVDNADPLNLGRVRLKVELLEIEMTCWARVLAPMAGKGRGTFFLPAKDDEVLVMFERGDLCSPYVIGSLWSAADPPPAEANEGQPIGQESCDAAPGSRLVDRCVIRSRSGHVITLDDTEGKEKITVVDKAEKNRIELDSVENRISITSAEGDISIRCRSLKIEATESYELKAPQGRVEATSGLDLHCMAGVKINTDGLVVT